MDIVLFGLLAWALLLFGVGYVLHIAHRKPAARWVAWVLALATVVFATFITQNKIPLYRMLGIISLQLLAMKVIVVVEVYVGKPKKRLSFVQWSAFVLYFGMLPEKFSTLFSKPLGGAGKLFWKGVSRILFGISLLFLSHKLQEARLPVFFLSEFVALVGLSFILHFGVLNVSTAFWRFWGVDVGEIFRAPYKAKSLPEFWSIRWNNAFTEMTQTIAFRPLVSNLGAKGAFLVGFFLSGVLHEIAISLPVASGYGLPTMYFVWQSLLMLAEKKYQFIKNITKHPILQHIWTFCWIALPLPLLFHARFIEQVVYPLRDAVLFGLRLV